MDSTIKKVFLSCQQRPPLLLAKPASLRLETEGTCSQPGSVQKNKVLISQRRNHAFLTALSRRRFNRSLFCVVELKMYFHT